MEVAGDFVAALAIDVGVPAVGIVVSAADVRAVSEVVGDEEAEKERKENGFL
jgi:hypothetical protein